jgi:ssDNA-binding Zn-finger/Zn-ribbon topoisomerase 1
MHNEQMVLRKKYNKRDFVQNSNFPHNNYANSPKTKGVEEIRSCDLTMVDNVCIA